MVKVGTIIATIMAGAGGWAVGRAPAKAAEENMRERLQLTVRQMKGSGYFDWAGNMPEDIDLWMDQARMEDIIEYILSGLQHATAEVTDPFALAALEAVITFLTSINLSKEIVGTTFVAAIT